MISKIISLLIILFVSNYFVVYSQVKETHIDWKSIKNSEGKIRYTLTKKWGGDLDNKDEMFVSPADISRDTKGNYYIVDGGCNMVFVYNNKGKKIREFGRKGSGPGDLNYPMTINVDKNDNVIVSEVLNKRIQIFSPNKKPKILSFANVETYTVGINNSGGLLLRGKSIKNGAPKLFVYDYNKKEIAKIGQVHNSKNNNGISAVYANLFTYCADNRGNIYMANSYGDPVIEKYSPDGKLLMKINYKLASPPEEIKLNGGNVKGTEGPGQRSIAVDSEENIYVLVQKRGFQKDEYKYLGGTVRAGNEIRRIPPKERKKSYDWHQIIVFDKYGNLKGAKSLDIFSGRIKIFDDNLFLIDSSMDAIIYQFKLEK